MTPSAHLWLALGLLAIALASSAQAWPEGADEGRPRPSVSGAQIAQMLRGIFPKETEIAGWEGEQQEAEQQQRQQLQQPSARPHPQWTGEEGAGQRHFRRDQEQGEGGSHPPHRPANTADPTAQATLPTIDMDNVQRVISKMFGGRRVRMGQMTMVPVPSDSEEVPRQIKSDDK